MGDFDGLRAAVAGGDGVVARFPGIVCVARCAPGDETHLRRLLDICRDVAGPAPGRPLARRLATWLGGVDAPPEALLFGAVSATGDDGLAVFCVGAVEMRIVDGAAATIVSGTQSAAWADRLLPRPDAPVHLVLDGATVAEELADSVHDLRSGVVPGAAVALLASDARSAVVAEAPVAAHPEPKPVPEPEPAPEPVPDTPARPMPRPPVATESAPAPQQPDAAPAEDQPTQLVPEAPPPPPGPTPPAQPRPPQRADPIIGGPAPESRPPLPVGTPLGSSSASTTLIDDATSISTPQAQGHLCARNHLNDPRSHFCVLCGIRMNERTGVLVLGTRPPLGLLVWDDGSTYTVDGEYLVGRMPDGDERVVSGMLRPIAVEDRSGSVSRVHVEVRLDGWNVVLVDSGSRNGTYLAAPGEEQWSPLPPNESRRLTPGTRVRLGARTFVFESPSGVR